MSSAEFTEWIAYHEIEPWGEYRADLRAGVIAATIANTHRGKRNSKTFKPSDFVLVKRSYRRKSAREWNQLMSVFVAMGSKGKPPCQ